MPGLSKLNAVCVDNGLFVDFALRIAPAFKSMKYWSPWANAFPKSNSLLPGDGFDEMQRVRNLFDAVAKADLVIFLDVYQGDMQEHLVKLGLPVWGARKGECLELDRMRSKEILKSYGVEPSPAVLIHGMDELREYLSKYNDVWVKVSSVRGDFETFQSRSYELSEPKLDELEHKLGAKKLIEEFIIEPDISPAVEWGIDTFTIDGAWPRRTFSGLEIKDLGFVGRVLEWDQIPNYLREPNEKLSSWFKEQNYRGFFSTELRILDDKTTYLTDPCCRLPSPPNEIYQMIFDNWAEIVWSGANGDMVDPNTTHKYGVCAMLHSSFADKNWQSIKFPEEIRDFVKLRNHCRIEGVDYVVPQETGLAEIGAVIGLGNTLEESIEHLKENAAQIKGYFLEVKLDAIETALDEKEKAAQLGIEI